MSGIAKFNLIDKGEYWEIFCGCLLLILSSLLRPQRRSLALKTILWCQPRNGKSHENNTGNSLISSKKLNKDTTLDGATTATNNHAKIATFYEQSSETAQPKQEVAIVGKRWRLNQPLQSCGAIRNTLSGACFNTIFAWIFCPTIE